MANGEECGRDDRGGSIREDQESGESNEKLDIGDMCVFGGDYGGAVYGGEASTDD